MVFTVFKTDIYVINVVAGSIPASSEFYLNILKTGIVVMKNPYASLVQVQKLLDNPKIQLYISQISLPIVTRIIQNTLQNLRLQIKENNKIFTELEVVDLCINNLEIKTQDRLQKVINATGILLHTNLGRSPIHPKIWDRAKIINTSFCNVEYTIKDGARGKRASFISELFAQLLGVEKVLFVNNNAAAVFFLCHVFGNGKDVIISRGELVQIGGGFRIPDILRASGANLVEVGTTNITSIQDYVAGITEDTAMILKVHSSNFKISGFTKSPNLKELRNAIDPQIPIVYDEGSGLLENNTLVDDICISSIMKSGADIVCFSGDKLLGSVQVGIIAGKAQFIDQLATHPLMRMFRVGKTTFSLLESYTIARLNSAEEGQSYYEQVLLTPKEKIKKNARFLIKGLNNPNINIVEESIEIGAGSSPTKTFLSYAIEIKNNNAQNIIKQLRMATPPVVAVIKKDSVLLFPITIFQEDLAYVKKLLYSILKK